MDLVSVYVGLDYHRDTIRVCVMNELGEVLLNRSVRSDAAAVIETVGGERGAKFAEAGDGARRGDRSLHGVGRVRVAAGGGSTASKAGSSCVVIVG